MLIEIDGLDTLSKTTGSRGFSTFTIGERLNKYISKNDNGCWIWNGVRQKSGHGRICINYKQMGTHRLVYEIYKGKIPEGLVLDHLCKTPSCVNPEHLEPVTQRINLLRGDTVSAKNSIKTHCKNGHEFIGENLRINNRGERCCKICHRNSDNESRKRKKLNGSF